MENLIALLVVKNYLPNYMDKISLSSTCRYLAQTSNVRSNLSVDQEQALNYLKNSKERIVTISMSSRSGRTTTICLYAEYLLSKGENFIIYNFGKKPYTKVLEKLDLILEDVITYNFSRIPEETLRNLTVIFDCSQSMSTHSKKQAENVYAELVSRCGRLILIQNVECKIQQGRDFCSVFTADETCPSLFRFVSCNNNEIFSNSSKPCNKLRVIKNVLSKNVQLTTFPYYTCNLKTFQNEEDVCTGRDFDGIQSSPSVSVYYCLKEGNETNQLIDHCVAKKIHVSNISSKSGVVAKKTDRVVIVFDKNKNASTTGKYNMYTSVRLLVDKLRERSLWSEKKSFTVIIDTCKSEEMTFAISLLNPRKCQVEARSKTGNRTPGFSPGVKIRKGNLCSFKQVFSELYVSRKLFQDRNGDGFYPCNTCVFFTGGNVLSVFKKKGEQEAWFESIKYELERERYFLEI